MKKINFPALTLCGFLSLGFFNCASAPEIKPAKENLEYKVDIERKSNTYVLEIRKGNLFIGINPVKSADGKAGYILGIYDERGKDEYIDMMFEVYEEPFEIFDELLKKNRMSNTNCYASEIKIETLEFSVRFNKKYELQGKEKKYRKWWHVCGKIYNKDSTIIDLDSDGNPDKIFYGDKSIEIFGNKSLEKEKDIIERGWTLFEKAKNYFLKNAENF